MTRFSVAGIALMEKSVPPYDLGSVTDVSLGGRHTCAVKRVVEQSLVGEMAVMDK